MYAHVHTSDWDIGDNEHFYVMYVTRSVVVRYPSSTSRYMYLLFTKYEERRELVMFVLASGAVTKM